MRLEITEEIGQLMLDGEILPGLFEGLEVEGALELDEKQVPGTSESSRQVQGFKPATVVFKAVLPSDDDSTAWEKLQIWTQRFKRTDDAARPFVRRIVNPHTAAYSIDQVIFVSLRSSDDNRLDSIKVEARFEEWRPAVRRKEAAATGAAELSPELQALLGFGGPTTNSPVAEARHGLFHDIEP
jgi:hypothetical protein